jgi:hypothetical protein
MLLFLVWFLACFFPELTFARDLDQDTLRSGEHINLGDVGLISGEVTLTVEYGRNGCGMYIRANDVNMWQLGPFAATPPCTLISLNDGRIILRDANQELSDLVGNRSNSRPKLLTLRSDGDLRAFTDTDSPLFVWRRPHTPLCESTDFLGAYSDAADSIRDMHIGLGLLDQLILEEGGEAGFESFLFFEVANPLLQATAGMYGGPLLGAAVAIFFNFLGFDSSRQDYTWLADIILERTELMINRAFTERELTSSRNELLMLCRGLELNGVWDPGLDAWLVQSERVFFKTECLFEHSKRSAACRDWQNTGSVVYALQYATMFHAVYLERVRTAGSREVLNELVLPRLARIMPEYRLLLAESLTQWESHRLAQVDLKPATLFSPGAVSYWLEVPWSFDAFTGDRIDCRSFVTSVTLNRVYRDNPAHYCNKRYKWCHARYLGLVNDVDRCHRAYLASIQAPINSLRGIVNLFGVEYGKAKYRNATGSIVFGWKPNDLE